jgi:diguanylate cyclase (GGDEF)-like protein
MSTRPRIGNIVAHTVKRVKELTNALRHRESDLEQESNARSADLNHLAHYDSLTGLPNRALFHETLRKTLAVGAHQGFAVAVLFIDVDHFKGVNDTLGHAAGDALLLQFGDRLTRSLRIRDTVGRLGGDEFAVILLIEDGESGAARVAEKLVAALRVPFDINGTAVSLSASIGIALHPDDAIDPDLLLDQADAAMYGAKQAGRDTFRFFTAEMNATTEARQALERALRAAVEQDQFVLHYQAKVDLGSGRICGFEALLRWQRPGRGLVEPAEFISSLEATGLIVRVGGWVIGEACRQINLWASGTRRPLSVSVNVSRRQLIEGDLVRDVTAALETHQIPPDLLELELTESAIELNAKDTISTLAALKAHGVRLSIDDFGTGHTSRASLARFPVDALKIDVAVVRDIVTDPDDALLALSIIQLAHSLKIDVIAEGVETAEQLAYLTRLHCDQMQGYLFSPPMPVNDVEALLDDGGHLPPDSASAEPRDTVLLFGEDPNRLDPLTALLVDDGIRVLSARSADDGLRLLALHHIHVLVYDQQSSYPAEDFLDLVRDIHPEALRMILARGNEMTAVTHAINRGPLHRYYTEPWDIPAIRRDVRGALRQQSLLPKAARSGRLNVDGPDASTPPVAASDSAQAFGAKASSPASADSPVA